LQSVFRLLLSLLPDDERESRVADAVGLVRSGELDPQGILCVRNGDSVVGVLVCVPVPGAGGLFWPPLVHDLPERVAIEDALVRHGVRWLRSRGARLGQALVSPADLPLGGPLLRNGFAHVTGLWYLRHVLDLTTVVLAGPERLAYCTYAEAPELLRATLLRTYEGTRDCPEVNGVRTIDEIVAGHQAQGRHDPGRWWVARAGSRPVGVLLLTDLPEMDSWDVCYVGVVPEARGRGYGRELMAKALLEAKAAGVSQVTLAVDARNEPAWQLYRRLGFEPVERREVLLAVWDRA
jgi:ribosomal protein S18 acetylase RimI-like enzyme